MTVLVLDSPELIARAAALEAAQTSDVQVDREQAKVDAVPEAAVASPHPYQPQSARESVLRRTESLALVS